MLLNQSRSPNLWLLFQRLIGGSKDKQALALSVFSDRGGEGEKKKHILEIGCSVGNIADAFRSLPHIRYTGIDIDKSVITVAQSRFTGTGFQFLHESMEEHIKRKIQYDYILVAGMLHHVDDETALEILKQTAPLSKPNATVLVYDPVTLNESDPFYMHWFYKLEQGQFMRDEQSTKKLITDAGMTIFRHRTVPVRPGLPGMPPVARFCCFEAKWSP